MIKLMNQFTNSKINERCYLLYFQGAEIKDVVNSGPGLVFLTYPDLVLSLPGSIVWAAIFFIMLLVKLPTRCS